MKLKNILPILALGLGLSTVAKADIISIAGSATYTSTNVTFTNGMVGSVGGTSTGIFAPFTPCAACVALTSFNYDGGFVPTNVFTVTESGNTVTLTLTSIDPTSGINSKGNLDIFGTGVLNGTGINNVAGTFNLSTQGGGGGAANVTFSATTTATPNAVPEPSSLLMLGTGLVGAAGIARRKLGF